MTDTMSLEGRLYALSRFMLCVAECVNPRFATAALPLDASNKQFVLQPQSPVCGSTHVVCQIEMAALQWPHFFMSVDLFAPPCYAMTFQWDWMDQYKPLCPVHPQSVSSIPVDFPGQGRIYIIYLLFLFENLHSY